MTCIKTRPTVIELEDTIAHKFLGMEAVFFSSTMANQNGKKLHTQPGETNYADKYAHVYLYEGRRTSFNSGVSFFC
jgi:threonine aldolase